MDSISSPDPTPILAISTDPETWKPIDGFPGYEISTWGRMRSLWGQGRSERRGPRSEPKILNGSLNLDGYRRYTMSGEGRRVSQAAHVLVLEAFVGPRPPGMDACHNDGDPANNRLDNLRWDTRSGNMLDAVRQGTHGMLKLDRSQVVRIWGRLVAGEFHTTIGAEFGISKTVISLIRSGRLWSHVTRHLPGWPLTSQEPDLRDPVLVPDHLADAATEHWRPIPDWPGYRISNRGRVQTCKQRVVGGTRGEWRQTDEWREIEPNLIKGYERFTLRDGRGRTTTMKVHRAVLLVFAGPCPPGMIGCHIDGNQRNNDAGNLRWDTPKSNSLDNVKHRKARSAG